MLFWLASYPSSGNTLTRALFNRCFGLTTRALHNAGDNRVLGASSVRGIVGHSSEGPDGAALIAEAQASSDIRIIKTHEAPPTQDPAIHIVRDGRSAIVSYYHYLNEIEKVDITLETVLSGDVYAGSWSSHYEMMQRHPWRLLVRYEDLVTDPDAVAARIGAFIGRAPKARFDLSFETMKAAQPAFFRSGRDDFNIAELLPYATRYRELHGRVAQQLGYGC
jgi:hypothetical protein